MLNCARSRKSPLSAYVGKGLLDIQSSFLEVTDLSNRRTGNKVISNYSSRSRESW